MTSILWTGLNNPEVEAFLGSAPFGDTDYLILIHPNEPNRPTTPVYPGDTIIKDDNGRLTVKRGDSKFDVPSIM